MPQKQEGDMELPRTTEVVAEAVQIIRECFKQFRLEEVFFSFNGGKDCTVLLDMTINLLRETYTKEQIEKDFKVLYIRTNHPFKEIEEFVKDTEEYYGITLSVTEGEMKTVLQTILEQNVKLKACLMGTRRTDPYSEDLQFMQKTDSNWPQVIRVFPLLNWSYHHIWSYILQERVPYCSLYDRGYTSIGSTHNTKPNPALAVNGVLYPAWHLADPSLERAGRITTSVTNGHEVPIR